MFCDQCGTEAAAGGHFCSNCGRPFPGPAAYQQVAAAQRVPVYVVPSNRVNAHIRILGILWIVSGALRALAVGWVWFVGRMVLPAVLNQFVPHFVLGDPLSRIVQGGLAFASGLLILQAALAFFTAWGLLERQSWGRIVGIVAGILALLHIPFGTALGVYTLWVLLPASSEAEYRNLAHV
ncbi:MAG: zinc ribbon domain-containing protein [Candidatus Acidiferrales bacterium]